MTGETDLATMLATLRIERREPAVTVVHLPSPVELGDGVLALVSEAEGTTAVVSIAEAERRGWPVEFRAAWLTVSVHSSLEAVGLTAALATALAERGIACNVLAGYFHDHLLVPLDRADAAVECLESLADREA
ncbi:MAG: ACT domain-containing protein [Microthrixaceae bacterium]